MNMEIYSMDIESMTKNANMVKDALLAVLERDGMLNKPAADIAENYAVVVSKAGWFGKFWKKLKCEGADAKELRYDVVKSV